MGPLSGVERPGPSQPRGQRERPPRRREPPRDRRRRRDPRVRRLVLLMAVAAVLGAGVALLTSHRHSQPVATAPRVVKVVIPEGSTRLQIARIAARDGLRGNYLDASRSSPMLNPTSFGAPTGTPNLEGFLFPATYEIYAGDSVARLVEDQLVAYSEKVGHSLDARARALHLTPYQLLIIASLIEREAVIPGDRPKIAAVILNRLRVGMPIGIDASIYYALELARGEPSLSGELTEADLQIDSPYNTRTHKGLPPTPIANPGLASLYAAAHPAHVAYMYYVAGADGCGEQVFSVTAAQFEVDAAAYQAAVAANGGQPPVCRHK